MPHGAGKKWPTVVLLLAAVATMSLRRTLSISDAHANFLEDYLESTVTLQYNKRKNL